MLSRFWHSAVSPSASGGATALDNVDFELLPGEIHGLVGENGAGKSTLMKILSGVHSPDEGEIVLRGEVVQFATPGNRRRVELA
jgi:ABC-type sugar transport system ATPase subunit